MHSVALAVRALPELSAVRAGKLVLSLASVLVTVGVVSKLAEMVAEPEGLAMASRSKDACAAALRAVAGQASWLSAERCCTFQAVEYRGAMEWSSQKT